jgi:ABC-type transport system involved in multi-copper enzyme maturation permease subunit
LPSRSSAAARQVQLTALLFKTELRQLLVGRSLWALLLILAPLLGFSFLQAAYVFAEASKSAERVPALAHSLSPLDGIEGPTLGALYLANTFLLPFVAIRLIGNDKQSGGIKLLLQLPVGPARLVGLKLVALMVVWALALVESLSAMVVWVILGGHLYMPELLSVVIGHVLYALVIAGVAFLAAALTESSATAAIVALAFTLGGWVLDFAGGTQIGAVRALAAFTPTSSLRALERGLLGSPQVLALLVPGIALLALAAAWLPTGLTRWRKAAVSAAVLGIAALTLVLGARFPVYADLSEDRRNSFNPSEEQALRRLDQELTITINLAPSDSRLKDLDRRVLKKLQRVVPRISVNYVETGATPLFGGGTDDKYGVTSFDYGGRHAETRATTAREILVVIFGLADARVQPEPQSEFYRGYPLVADARATAWWFYAGLPALCLVGWWLSRRPTSRARGTSPAVRRRPRWPPRMRLRWTVPGVVIAALAIQAVPYGHDLATPAARARSAVAGCATGRAPGDAQLTTIAELRAESDSLSGHLTQALTALEKSAMPVVVQYVGQFGTGYERVRAELARLYPRRCAALDQARVHADEGLFQRQPPDIGAIRLGLTALRASFDSINRDLDGRTGTSGATASLAAQAAEPTAPSVTGEPPWDSQQTRDLALRACGACHSNQSNMPWYTQIAPVSWVTQRDVDLGREVLNFSEWDRIQVKAVLAANDVETRHMPPAYSSTLLPGTQLSADERVALSRGLEDTFGGWVGIVITMTDFAFSPNVLRIDGGEGQRIVLSLQNNGELPHSFFAPALDLLSDEVGPGQTLTLDFISTREESVRFVCTIQGHERDGMVGYITIE